MVYRVAYGAWNQQTATTQTLGGYTWYTKTYDLSQLKAISGDYTDAYFSISFRNSDGTWCSNDPNGDNPGWGIKNNSDGVGRLPDNLYFVIDPNIIYKQTTLGEKGWAGIHETTKLEILNEYILSIAETCSVSTGSWMIRTIVWQSLFSCVIRTRACTR